jgi:hypothetical protein
MWLVNDQHEPVSFPVLLVIFSCISNDKDPEGESVMSKAMQAERKMWSKHYTYDEWMEAQGIPVYHGYYIEDLRTLQLGWWDQRQCNSAFIQLVGQEGVTSARVTEIPQVKRCRRSNSPSMRSFM